VTTARDLDRLPADARGRLETFATALERIAIEDYPLYAVRNRQPVHRRAVEAAAVLAREAGLTEAVEAARSALVEAVGRAYANAQLRVTFAGRNDASGLGPAEDRLFVMRSIGDAVTGIVLWDRLDPYLRAELTGAWAAVLEPR
jgi:hypothetical protein